MSHHLNKKILYREYLSQVTNAKKCVISHILFIWNEISPMLKLSYFSIDQSLQSYTSWDIECLQKILKMRYSFPVCFIADFVICVALLHVARSSLLISSNETPSVNINHCDKVLVCNCDLNQDSNVSKAIKALETKLEKLIALVNRTATPQPQQAPGNPLWNNWSTFLKLKLIKFPLSQFQ